MIFEYVELSSVAEVFNGKTPSRAEQRDEGFPVLKIRDVDDAFLFRGEFQSFIDKRFYDQYEEKRISLFDSLILNAAHNSSYVGSKQYCAEKAVVGAIATGEWLICRANKTVLDERYLNFWLRSESTRFQMSGLVKGIHLYPKDVARLKIPLPPLSTQKQIAAILEKADQLRKDCQQMEQELNNLAQSVFIDMFGEPVANPKGWDVLPLRDIISGGLQNGAYYPKEDYSNTGVEMVHMSDVFYDFVPRGQMKRVNASSKDIEKYRLTSRDLLISRRSLMLEGAAKPSLIQESNEDLIFESSMIRLTPDSKKVTVKYLFYYLSNPLVKSNYIFQYVTGATIKGINQTNLEKVSILVPDLKLQKKFDLVEEKIRNQKESLRELAGKHSDNFNSLMQQAFNGQLKLKNRAA